MAVTASPSLTLGPLLFNWPVDRMRDFYARIADEAPVDTVHLGETVCSKRAPFFADALPDIAGRLERAGKRVVWSSLSLVADHRDLRAMRELVDGVDGLVEVNDLTVLPMLNGRPHVIGPMVNVYNEGTLTWLAGRGTVRICLPPEVSGEAVAAMARAAGSVDLELLVFGRMPLALSARCYHARAHGLHKDGCQFVCGEDSDGLALETLDGQPFLAINGTQTLSHALAELSGEARTLVGTGITHFRLSPHAVDMPAIATVWRDLLDGRLDPATARERITALAPFGAPANGYYHGHIGAAAVASDTPTAGPL